MWDYLMKKFRHCFLGQVGILESNICSLLMALHLSVVKCGEEGVGASRCGVTPLVNKSEQCDHPSSTEHRNEKGGLIAPFQSTLLAGNFPGF